MARNYLQGLKVLNGLVFLGALALFLSIFSFTEIYTASTGETALIAFINSVRKVVTSVIYIALYFIGIGISYVIGGLFGAIGTNNVIEAVDMFYKNFFGSWFTFSTADGKAPSIDAIIEIIGDELLVLLTDLYLIAFQVLFAISIYYAIRAVLQSNPKYNLRVIGCLILMIVLPLMVFGFRDMLELFGITNITYLTDLPNPVNTALTQLPLDNLLQFFGSPIASLAIVSYIYLELSFQINYTDLVTKPSLERSDRLEAQLSILQRESHHVVANVDKIREEAKQRKQELELKKESVGKYLAKSATSGFSYVKEMIEKKKLEAEEKKLVTAASKTRRLGSFVERLFREDAEAEDTLTAKSAKPRATHLATSTFLNFGFRLIILIIISFVIIHPHWFFVNIFRLPPAITESVAMYSPEVIIVLLLPFVLTFPVIAQVISYVKHRNLMIRLKQEGQIKQILTSVGDYVKVEEETEEDKEKKKEKEEDKEPTLTEEATTETT